MNFLEDLMGIIAEGYRAELAHQFWIEDFWY